MNKLNDEKLVKKFETLQEVAIDLIRVNDLDKLLKLILDKACELLTCDAGSLYIQEDQGELIFNSTFNFSKNIDFKKQKIVIDENSVAGHCFLNGASINIGDVYKLGVSSKFKFNTSFDEKFDYRTKSMIAQALINKKGEVIGVLQLMNRKNEYSDLWPTNTEQVENMPTFDSEDEKLLASFSSLASASLENAMLYENIEQLFESFVQASVQAIEARDVSTRGHSERVAVLCVDFAENLNRVNSGHLGPQNLNNAQIKELKYAALLHDFGKIGVSENTLLKEKKLFPEQLEAIRNRLFTSKYLFQTQLQKSILDRIVKGENVSKTEIEALQFQIKQYEKRTQSYWDHVLNLNEPSVIDEEKHIILTELKKFEVEDEFGKTSNLLNDDEIYRLSITRGSLSKEEREEIESHVTHTYQFLKQIPWTKELKALPEIAFGHHEKLDGSGYPRRIQNTDIPVQTRMMTICDIFDALVASDRPYKKSMPVEKALAIIERDVKGGKLDNNLFQLFLDSKVFENKKFHSLKYKKAA